jgi:hypothetical protein
MNSITFVMAFSEKDWAFTTLPIKIGIKQTVQSIHNATCLLKHRLN